MHVTLMDILTSHGGWLCVEKEFLRCRWICVDQFSPPVRRTGVRLGAAVPGHR